MRTGWQFRDPREACRRINPRSIARWSRRPHPATYFERVSIANFRWPISNKEDNLQKDIEVEI